MGGANQHMAGRTRGVPGRHVDRVQLIFIRKAPVPITVVLRSYSACLFPISDDTGSGHTSALQS